MNKIKLLIFVSMIAILVAQAPVVAATAPPLPGIEGPGGVPHYFGPYANWAFSPLPKGSYRHDHCGCRRYGIHRSYRGDP